MKKNHTQSAEALIPIRQTVDALLLDYGCYEPLELLQLEGRLIYSDYESWRAGDVENLDDLLTGDNKAIRALLENAASYASELGLQPEFIAYSGWGDSSGSILCIHSDAPIAQAVGSLWAAPEEKSQMDLFMDSPAASLSNSLRVALASRDPVKARQSLEKLYNVDSAHAELALLETLIIAQENAGRPVENVIAELQMIQHKIVPAAHDILKNRAQDYLSPLWRRLSAELCDLPFDPGRPDHHCSYTHEQSRDWQNARNAIEQEPGWDNHPILLARHIRACSQLGDEPASQLSCFRLCWKFPEQANDFMEEYLSLFMKVEWQKFLDQEELNTDEFPAWMMIHFPSLSRSQPEQIQNMDPDNYNDYRLAHRLQQKRGTKLDNKQLALRKALQKQSPGLFTYFIAQQPG